MTKPGNRKWNAPKGEYERPAAPDLPPGLRERVALLILSVSESRLGNEDAEKAAGYALIEVASFIADEAAKVGRADDAGPREVMARVAAKLRWEAEG